MRDYNAFLEFLTEDDIVTVIHKANQFPLPTSVVLEDRLQMVDSSQIAKIIGASLALMEMYHNWCEQNPDTPEQ